MSWSGLRTRKFLPAAFRSLLPGLALLLVAEAASAMSLRCAQGIVSRGDDPERVRKACGEPAHTESWPAAPPLAAGAVWFYNEGPSRLLRLLRFRADRLVAVQTQGYGFREPDHASCAPGDARRGWSAYRLLAFCGEPDQRQVLGRMLTPRRADPTGPLLQRGQRAVHRQRWRYDFGPRHLPREYTLDDGIVTEVRSLSRDD